MIFERIGELTGHAENIGGIEFLGGGVEFGLGLEEADAEADAHIQNAVAEHRNKTVGGDGILQAAAELLGGGGAVIFDIFCPLFGLRFHHEIDEDLGIEGFFLVVGVFLDPLPVGVLIGELFKPAVGTDQKGFDVVFKTLFGCIHHLAVSSNGMFLACSSSAETSLISLIVKTKSLSWFKEFIEGDFLGEIIVKTL